MKKILLAISVLLITTSVFARDIIQIEKYDTLPIKMTQFEDCLEKTNLIPESTNGCENFNKIFTYSKIGVKYGIENKPNSEQISNGKRLFKNILKPISNQYSNLIVTSAFRNEKINRLVGGSLNSQHMTGEALDFHVPGISHKEVARWIIGNLKFDQLILEPTWIHISYSDKNKNEVLTYKNNRFYNGIR